MKKEIFGLENLNFIEEIQIDLMDSTDIVDVYKDDNNIYYISITYDNENGLYKYPNCRLIAKCTLFTLKSFKECDISLKELFDLSFNTRYVNEDDKSLIEFTDYKDLVSKGYWEYYPDEGYSSILKYRDYVSSPSYSEITGTWGGAIYHKDNLQSILGTYRGESIKDSKDAFITRVNELFN